MIVSRLIRSRWLFGTVCFIVGAAVILGIRFFTYKPDTVHYHANFALYINGQRELFKGKQYYEETEMCSASSGPPSTPTERAHMHDNVNDVVHVEDHAVTWGQFFANLGWYMGSNAIESPDGTAYVENDTSKLHLILNGQDYTDLGGLSNTVIKDQDKLLVSFGNENDATLTVQYKAIPSTAHHYDITPDPKSCSGQDHATTLHDKLVHLF